jgi:hypothetical protein
MEVNELQYKKIKEADDVDIKCKKGREHKTGYSYNDCVKNNNNHHLDFTLAC